MESRTARFIDEDQNTFIIRMPPEASQGDDVEDAHHQFIIDHWPDLAAASYLGFKRFGIGFVVVNQRDSQAEDVTHDFDAHTILYASAESDWIQGSTSPASAAWLDEQLQTYDPNVTAVLLFTGEANPLRAYAVDGTPEPPQAFTISRAPYN